MSFQTHTDTSGIEMVQLSDDQKITKRGNYHFDIPAIMQVIAQMDDKVQLFNLKGTNIIQLRWFNNMLLGMCHFGSRLLAPIYFTACLKII